MADKVTSNTELDYDRSVIGVEVEVGTFPVPRDQIVAFAVVVGETNPLYLDDDAARAQGFRGVVAPPTFYTVFPLEGGLDPKVTFGNTGFNAGQHCEFLEPIQAGDTITARTKVADVFAKTGRTGTMAFIVRETSFYNQEGRLVVRVEHFYVRRNLERDD
ncbi:MAG: MaoC family dehydratase N-terminal domain-containing protein [Chloroflexi bacterium]|nr:MaoC family dehydratase N-terminal domain-containing protein [Chloroflexota bacterium]